MCWKGQNLEKIFFEFCPLAKAMCRLDFPSWVEGKSWYRAFLLMGISMDASVDHPNAYWIGALLHSASFLFQILQDDRSCSVLQLNRPIMISQAKYSLCDIQSSRLISGRNYSSDHPTSVISVKFHACIICTLAIRTLLWPILFPVSSCLWYEFGSLIIPEKNSEFGCIA